MKAFAIPVGIRCERGHDVHLVSVTDDGHPYRSFALACYSCNVATRHQWEDAADALAEWRQRGGRAPIDQLSEVWN